jgi:regulator of protease activity HflC (stomatin/prohibitin superfamily)
MKQIFTWNEKTLGLLTGFLVLVIFLLGLGDSLVQIDSGYVGILSDFGSVQDSSMQPGLHIIVPVYQSVAQVSVQPQTVTSNETASTHDLQIVNTAIAVTFTIPPGDAPNFYKNFRDINTLSDRIITPDVSNDVKAITADYDAEELVTKRDLVDEQIKKLITDSLAPYDIAVEAVNISNFAFSDGYTQAIEAKQVAQQQALQAQYTLQQTVISSQQQVVQAKAAADAAVETAKGQATALLINATAQAKSNALIANSLTPVLLQQKALDRWSGVLPQYLSAGAPLPFIGSVPAMAQPK